jgi:hypothetical protein
VNQLKINEYLQKGIMFYVEINGIRAVIITPQLRAMIMPVI